MRKFWPEPEHSIDDLCFSTFAAPPAARRQRAEELEAALRAEEAETSDGDTQPLKRIGVQGETLSDVDKLSK